MRKHNCLIRSLLLVFLVGIGLTPGCKTSSTAFTHTKETQTAVTPQQAVQLLKEGNRRFTQGQTMRRDVRWHVKVTADGQYPYAVILSCLDSRASAELIFDQGI